MGVDAIVVRHALRRRALADRPLGRRRGHQRRRRLARAPHPGPARRLHDPPASWARSTGRHIAIVGDVKHSRVARSDVRRLHRPRRRGHPGGPAHAAAAAASRAGRSRSATTSTPCCPSVDVVYLLRMQQERMTEALVPSLREYTAALRPHPAPGRPAAPTTPLVMHPGPMNRGVEIAAEVADLPRRGDHRPGAQRRRRAHGGALPAARLRAWTGRQPPSVVDVAGRTTWADRAQGRHASSTPTGDAPGRRR